MLLQGKFVFCFVLIVAVTVCAVSVSAQGTLKLGFVDMNELFDKSPKFQKALNDLKQIKNTTIEELKAKQQKLKDDFESFKLKKEYMQEDKVKEQQLELNKSRDEFLRVTETEEKAFLKTQEEKLTPLYTELKSAIEALAKEEGYSFIFRRSDIWYADPQFDLTAKIIKKMGE